MTLKKFVQVSPQKIEELENLLEARLPRSAMVYNVLKLYKTVHNTETANLTFKIWAYDDNLEKDNAFIMMSIRVKGLPQNLIVVSSPVCPCEEALTSLSNCIDWSQPNQFEGIETAVAYSVVLSGRRVGKIFEHDPIGLYYLPKEAHKKESIYPDTVVVKQLISEDATLVNSRWPAACEGSLEMLSESIEFVGSAGVYVKENLKSIENNVDDKNNSKLVSWAVALPFGSIHALFTEPEHQRKGYAQLTMAEVSRFIAKQNRIPVVQIYKTNDTSKSVNEKVGYVYSHDINLIHYYPNN